MLENFLFKWPVSLMSRWRIFLFRLVGISIGRRNRFESGRFRGGKQIIIGNNNAFTEGFKLWPDIFSEHSIKIVIGNNNYFNRGLFLDACGTITIGNDNMIGPDVYMTDSNHGFGLGVSPGLQPMVRGEVKIGNSCWIGAKCIILKGVELGDFCVVAAGAVVTKSFPSGSVIAGVPAKLIKQLTN